MERKDPAFVMNHAGEIIAYEGNKKKLVDKFSFNKNQDFFEDKYSAVIKHFLNDCKNNSEVKSLELHSEKLNLSYNIHVKCDHHSKSLLAWFQDITARKKLDAKLHQIHQSFHRFQIRRCICYGNSNLALSIYNLFTNVCL